MNKLAKISVSLACGILIGWGAVAPAVAGGQHNLSTYKSKTVKVQNKAKTKLTRLAKIDQVAVSRRIVKIRTKSKISAPIGLMIFCMKQPQHCKGGGRNQMAMNDNLSKVLNRTNRAVNRSIRPRYDKKGDVWSINVRYGDCEDYVLTKRAKLIKQGISPNSLRIATAYTRRGEGHAVLVVRTNKGDFVLDNRRNTILEWHKTGLRWISLSGGNLRGWKHV